MTRIKLALLFIWFIISISAFSQSENPETGLGKDNWMIGGTVWFTEHASFNNIEYSIDPRAGYFISEKFVVGLNASYYFEGVENFQSRGIGPFARYYFINKRLAPFLEAAYTVGWTRTQVSLSGEHETESSQVYGAGAGLDLFIMKNIAVEGTLKYLWYDEVSDGRFSLNIGFQIFLIRRKAE